MQRLVQMDLGLRAWFAFEEPVRECGNPVLSPVFVAYHRPPAKRIWICRIRHLKHGSLSAAVLLLGFTSTLREAGERIGQNALETVLAITPHWKVLAI